MYKINLLNKFNKGYYLNGVYYPPQKKSRSKIYRIFFLSVFLGIFLFSWQVFSSFKENSIQKSNYQKEPYSIIRTIKNGFKKLASFSGLIKTKENHLKGEKEDRINILLLGMGGKGHDGGTLSDTIIIASFQPSKKKVSLLSIPRDLYVPIEKHGWKKINHAYAYGEAQKKGNGAILATNTVSKIFNIPIHYYVNVDFQGFKEIIDHLGGVDIYVERSFKDEKYPDENFGYEPVEFKKGWERMNGERALKYARSRHGNNNEASDFARAKRQQKILMALKKKISDYHFWLNPTKIGQLLADLNNHINSNFKTWEIIKLAKELKDVNQNNIIHITLSDGPKGQLYATNLNGAYILLPKGNDFTLLKSLAKNIFQNNQGKIAGAKIQKPILTNIEVLNGTTISGLASKTAKKLKQNNFKIVGIGNAPEQNYKKTIIYDLTNKQKINQLKILEKQLSAEIVFHKPKWYQKKNQSSDFLIVLGSD